MKSFLRRLRQAGPPQSASPESAFFTTTLAAHGYLDLHTPPVPWEARAIEVGATRLPQRDAGPQLAKLWERDRYLGQLESASLRQLGEYFYFASVAAQRDVIRQDENGSFMAVVLSGQIAVERQQPWGERMRLAQTRPGDILGEMSLLDGGPRFSSCTTLTDCEIGVLSAEALDDMMTRNAALAAKLMALLARKLSFRLRAISVRLGEEQHT
ncbi:cyclic nucleotide-binding domain-containing protein [Delftia sp. PS-11]|uniref:cyclic nucleotide-binding domain-containing protein n=1 Tax=Delftia sp. PS-11 TaxID=2767222 RepID=UPI0024540720|nr:cyclic nucleotide-binding domain-containing protein [Delftia sp. PS-11]KAJ8743465.1 cyclic nucleotide-binding domain-containing protein [Delftia sp. PS-11]